MTELHPQKPFSPSCENNKEPILTELLRFFKSATNVLEIGSGTGQHAVHFAAHLPHLQWQCADQLDYHQGILQWLAEYDLANLHPPLSLHIPSDPWPTQSFDAYFTANTAHIMLKDQIRFLMQQLNVRLSAGNVFCQYGPFTINGEFSSESNLDFHHKLIQGGYGGYRDLDELQQWAPNLNLVEVINMPANNLMLVWKPH